MNRRRVRACRNPRCGELLPPAVRLELCPSCRFAAGAGSLVAFIVSFVVELLRSLL